jgi:hypothetical protein
MPNRPLGRFKPHFQIAAKSNAPSTSERRRDVAKYGESTVERPVTAAPPTLNSDRHVRVVARGEPSLPICNAYLQSLRSRMQLCRECQARPGGGIVLRSLSHHPADPHQVSKRP